MKEFPPKSDIQFCEMYSYDILESSGGNSSLYSCINIGHCSEQGDKKIGRAHV